MKVATYEATVENGQIKIAEHVRLPEHARVYVVVPGVNEAPSLRVRSPRLAQQQQSSDFAKEVTESINDASV